MSAYPWAVYCVSSPGSRLRLLLCPRPPSLPWLEYSPSGEKRQIRDGVNSTVKSQKIIFVCQKIMLPVLLKKLNCIPLPLNINDQVANSSFLRSVCWIQMLPLLLSLVSTVSESQVSSGYLFGPATRPMFDVGLFTFLTCCHNIPLLVKLN